MFGADRFEQRNDFGLAAVQVVAWNAGAALPAPTVTTTSSTPEEGCHPDYSPCIPYFEGDALNCGDLTAAQKPVTVLVVGVDPYRLDGEGDGQGCTN